MPRGKRHAAALNARNPAAAASSGFPCSRWAPAIERAHRRLQLDQLVASDVIVAANREEAVALRGVPVHEKARESWSSRAQKQAPHIRYPAVFAALLLAAPLASQAPRRDSLAATRLEIGRARIARTQRWTAL
jgi:hypothetical protein